MPSKHCWKSQMIIILYIYVILMSRHSQVKCVLCLFFFKMLTHWLTTQSLAQAALLLPVGTDVVNEAEFKKRQEQNATKFKLRFSSAVP